MKNLAPITILILAVVALCVWDGIFTQKTFTKLNTMSEEIYDLTKQTSNDFSLLSKKVEDLNTYWLKQSNVLCISISRKDLQPVTDYIQYLDSAVKNQSEDDCLMYSRLLDYNIKGLSEAYGISIANLL